MLRDGPRVEEEDILDLGEVLGVRVDAGTRSPVCLVGRLFSEKGYNVFALLNVMTKMIVHGFFVINPGISMAISLPSGTCLGESNRHMFR
ncbi:hypothetical protein ACS0TY_004002 [Phlomoides rotata]